MWKRTYNLIKPEIRTPEKLDIEYSNFYCIAHKETFDKTTFKSDEK